MTNTQQKEKPNFLYYTDWAEQLLSFPADLRLKIDDAVKRYVLYGEEPTDRDVLYYAGSNRPRQGQICGCMQ